MDNIELVKITTDICYIIGGYFDAKHEDGEIYRFINETGITIIIDMDEKQILVEGDLPRMESYALNKLAIEHGL